jgi:hypothetical protein
VTLQEPYGLSRGHERDRAFAGGKRLLLNGKFCRFFSSASFTLTTRGDDDNVSLAPSERPRPRKGIVHPTPLLVTNSINPLFSGPIRRTGP